MNNRDERTQMVKEVASKREIMRELAWRKTERLHEKLLRATEELEALDRVCANFGALGEREEP